MHIEVRKVHVLILSLLLVAVGVVAYGTSAPSTFGHNSAEVDVTVGGVTKTLQQAITDGSIGAGGGGGGGTVPVATGARLLVKNVSFAHGWSDGTTCVVTTDGRVACSGNQDHGQRGLGMQGISNAPFFHFLPLTGVKQLEGSSHGFCAVYDAPGAPNKLACWGDNVNGQVGIGSTASYIHTPVQPSLAVGDQVAKVVSSKNDYTDSYSHTCVLLTSGNLKCWGYNGNGELGDNTQTVRTSPVTVPLAEVSDVAIGGARTVGYTCAKVTSGGQDSLYCWGYNGNGELGDGTTGSKSVPTPVSGMQGVQIKQLVLSSSSGSQSCALMGGTNDGKVWCWGYNHYGSVGVDDPASSITAPRPVPGFGGSDPKAIKISIGGGWGSGAGQLCGLRTDGKVLCAGYNNYGQLGDGTTTERRMPVVVQNSLGQPLTDVIDILAVAPNSYGTTCALHSSGKVSCWGNNAYGQVGVGHTDQVNRATEVMGITTARSISGGGYSNAATFCAVLADATVKCWGYNGQGELGNGLVGGYASVPVQPL